MTKEQKREYNRKYYHKHKEELDKRTRQWYEDNPNWRKEYYQKNKEKFDERAKEWRDNNRKRFTELCNQSRKRRVERLKAEGVKNVWGVVVKGEKPRYESANSKEN